MKRIYIAAVVIALILGLTACGSKPETIEGYWMTEDGETISFNSNGKAIIDGISLDYSIYDENNLSILFWGFAEEYRFSIEKDVLTLTDLSNNSHMTYYRDEDKQAEIQERLNEIAAAQAEQERIQQELEAQAQAQEDYEKYVKSLKNRIESIDTEIAWTYEYISDNEGYIADNEGYIADNEEYIQEEHNTINELENKIAELQYSTDELAQGEIEVLRGQQEVCYGVIEVHNEQIKMYREGITEYRQEIADLEAKKEEIIEELKELGEY